MAKFLDFKMPEHGNVSVLINVGRANYIVFDEDTNSATFWFGQDDAYAISGSKEEILGKIRGMDNEIRS